MHIFPVRVYYSDTDCGGIVYHARYLDFAEHARTELLREIAQRHRFDGNQSAMLNLSKTGFVVKSITIDYRKPAKLDDLLEVRTTVTSMKRFSMTLTQQVFKDEDLIADLLVKVAAIHLDTLKPQPLGDDLQKAFLGG
ncbi:MAG: Acyl-CoA thioester hydrolase YbgC [Spirochaetes bacterium ADurb.Bin315]|mgnify:FL=1|jgi:acyl-CoA thioester hydrolase|nr:YbgC/FadM family acyl-CoA thioesterase [Spirochaetota bacterium]OQA42356.1 MAG: Acyl-CoA thioester hydrolase YbgC [Spirochaetes bacterium ADurb.Bin315]HOE89845.1 YbgC/FadM family acyl-CoA thioesterase [Sphaerochaeta sp.]HOR80564.1 YbgC/FadM family acyl-CoA thioesterase [Sphaerochaeta sp.]HPK64319.1 YbgC/FadM family acyl-CoA thioesterase [Sphaerochaeta sp.]